MAPCRIVVAFEHIRLWAYLVKVIWETHRAHYFISTSLLREIWIGVRVMVFYATFKNISFISWRSVLFVDEAGVPGENQRTAESHWQTSSHNDGVSILPRLSGIRTHNISGDRHSCLGSCKFNYNTMTATTYRTIWCLRFY